MVEDPSQAAGQTPMQLFLGRGVLGGHPSGEPLRDYHHVYFHSPMGRPFAPSEFRTSHEFLFLYFLIAQRGNFRGDRSIAQSGQGQRQVRIHDHMPCNGLYSADTDLYILLLYVLLQSLFTGWDRHSPGKCGGKIFQIKKKVTSQILRALIPGMILQGINDQFKSYMTTLDLARPFGVINLGAIALNVVLGYVFITVLEMPIWGFPICKFINEVIVSVLIMILWCYKVEPKCKTKILWGEYRKEIFGYLWTSLKVIAGFYCTFLGFELNTYFAGLTHDNVQIAAYVGWVNLAGIVFCTGIGFGIIGRTRVGTLVGAKKFADAKNLMWFNLSVTLAFGVFICILFNSIRYYITLIYTGIPEVSETMGYLIMIYAFNCILEFSNGSLGCYMRLTGHIKCVSFLMFFYIVVIQGSLSYVLCFVCDFGVSGLLYSFATTSVLLNVTNLVTLWRCDWSSVTDGDAAEDEEEGEDTEGEGEVKALSVDEDFGYGDKDNARVHHGMEIQQKS